MVRPRLRSLGRALWQRLGAIDFLNEAMLFGAGLLISLLPLLIILSEFANQRIDDDLALHLGLDHQAATIVTHLFNQSSPAVSAATVTSLIFVIAGTLAVVSSLQHIYEKVFDEPPRGMRNLPRLVMWTVVLGAVLTLVSLVGKPVRDLGGGSVLVVVLMFAVFTPFLWWTMHFLLAGRVPWRALLPSAVATGVLFAGLGLFSEHYFSSSIVSDDRTYGPIGAVFSIMSWLIAIGAVLLVGAVAGPAWREATRGAATPETPLTG
jgi:membrane protein